ncbi:tyrosine-protein phosphatase [Chloroflexia bacterium SDU3-3]|nr:tyrosine-protein phosphatase [Chloroflexia bacterium SDU3-3]
MPLDESQTCPNLRDVGAFVNLIVGQPLLPEQRLYRAGKLDAIFSPEDIHAPATIINLRRSPDPSSFGAAAYHIPTRDHYETYATQRPEVRQWLNQVMRVFANPQLAYPVLIHCTAGRDRTGVVVAALLRLLEIPDHVIIEEYLLSDGDVQGRRIRQALDGIGRLTAYFQRLDIGRVRANIMRSTTCRSMCATERASR